MSHWLKSVNTLLEKLDDRAETVAAERTGVQEDENPGDIHDILTKRGLGSASREDDDQGDLEVTESEWGGLELNIGDAPKKTSGEDAVGGAEAEPAPSRVEPRPANVKDGNTKEEPVEPLQTASVVVVAPVPEKGEISKLPGQAALTQHSTKVKAVPPAATPPVEHKDEADATYTDTDSKEQQQQQKETKCGKVVPTAPEPNGSAMKSNLPPPPPKKNPPAPKTAPSVKPQKNATSEAKEAQKEARTLRRHVVSLNSQLEAAESELQAQRKELELAAERMEKDRKKVKLDKEALQKKNAQELVALKMQHQQILTEQEARHEKQIASFRATIEQVEDKRQQEGGNMNKELAQFQERGQEMSDRINILNEEKSVLLTQIETLQGQQSALGSRLESLTQAADNAMAREREAEDRLDSILTQHARQISQRQAREAELESTVSDLNAALVVAKHSTISRSDTVEKTGSTGDSSLIAKNEALQQDLETATSHLSLERERSEALHQQLKAMSRESTQEASAVHAKQIHYERQIAQMSLTISKLEASLREAQKGSEYEFATTDPEKPLEEANTEQIAVLSEEVFRLRDKIASHNNEALAMKGRLQSATDRAKQLEEELAVVNMKRSNDCTSIDFGAPSDGLDRRRRRGANQPSSIRSVMQLDVGRGERREQLGKVVDVVDSFAVTTGKYLKRNPLARAGFIFYLLLVHLWTFLLLFVHAHSFDEYVDHGAATPHGPHALMQQHQTKSQP